MSKIVGMGSEKKVDNLKELKKENKALAAKLESVQAELEKAKAQK